MQFVVPFLVDRKGTDKMFIHHQEYQTGHARMTLSRWAQR
jgi:hypothetical protein